MNEPNNETPESLRKHDFYRELQRIESGLDTAGCSSEAQHFADYIQDLEHGTSWQAVWTRIRTRYENTGNDDLLAQIRATLPAAELLARADELEEAESRTPRCPDCDPFIIVGSRVRVKQSCHDYTGREGDVRSESGHGFNVSLGMITRWFHADELEAVETAKAAEPAWKPTTGPWTLGNENNECAEVMAGDTSISFCRHDINTGKIIISREEMLANVHFVIQASEVASETGLTPRQLAEKQADLERQNAALREALEKIANHDYTKEDKAVTHGEPTTIWQAVAREALERNGGAA